MGIFGAGRPKKYNPSKKKGKKPPAKAGLYMIRNGRTGKRKYGGETGNLLERMRQHITSGKLKK